MTVTELVYDAFQRAELDRWNDVISDDVEINSPAGNGMRGLQVLKDWAQNFVELAWRIDLVDEHLALDETQSGRGFITFLLHWKHTRAFLGMPPTGREGTSVETILLTIVKGVVTRIDVASNTSDLVLYEYERGWPMPHNVRPPALIEGTDRRDAIAALP